MIELVIEEYVGIYICCVILWNGIGEVIIKLEVYCK